MQFYFWNRIQDVKVRCGLCMQWRIQSFSAVGVPTPKVVVNFLTYYLAIFPTKTP